MKRFFKTLVAAGLFLLAACGGEQPDQPSQPALAPAQSAVRSLQYSIVKKYPHDTSAFTEGLLFHEGKLFESTGSPDNMPSTRSLFGVVNLESGKIDVKAELDRKIYFGEGIVIFGDKLYQVTWRNQKGFIYDVHTFRQQGQFNYPNAEGWGLTTDGKSIIMSDGTNNLTWFDPATMKVTGTLGVSKDGYAVDNINELEWVNGYLYANIWMTNRLIKIDPSTGNVVAEGDFSALYTDASRAHARLSEMNGIAYDAASGKMLVTGKMWPYYYEVRLSE
jgi:glutamine cyclotransferase